MGGTGGAKSCERKPAKPAHARPHSLLRPLDDGATPPAFGRARGPGGPTRAGPGAARARWACAGVACGPSRVAQAAPGPAPSLHWRVVAALKQCSRDTSPIPQCHRLQTGPDWDTLTSGSGGAIRGRTWCVCGASGPACGAPTLSDCGSRYEAGRSEPGLAGRQWGCTRFRTAAFLHTNPR